MMGPEFSVSMCPVFTQGDYFRRIVVHETCGHAFGKLLDEYITNKGQTMPAKEASNITNAKKYYDIYANIDVSPDISETSWADFDGVNGYSMVGTFEGGNYYTYGVWRPEFNSCMNDNVLYFNAPSRFAQIRRIHKWGGTDTHYTIEEFIADDIRPPYPTTTRTADRNMPPLGPPILLNL
jgi:hypothetical protein